ncbi:MAG: pyridoxine 5'-phosphate synthase [Flavobacteriales bacterium]|nr:pyridoxine 5'-phosphate synthase [Flavobacteriales bacterium]MBL6869331.1 pyridoxine 5'-phosphate synthase [Flavobacteriales bacterium]
MIALSVNINKIATLRNARGGIIPNVIEHAKNIELFGANGITVHPRPDERHITYQDVRELKKVLKVELNIEGNPKENSFVDLVLETKPSQVTLVPDEIGQLTSDHGWDTIKEKDFLCEMVQLFSNNHIRTSLFINPDEKHVEGAKEIGSDRIELYTESYASSNVLSFEKAIEPFVKAANKANELGIEINAGHDLNLENLKFFATNIPNLKEVSIGHALIADALNYGMENTVNLYLRALLK